MEIRHLRYVSEIARARSFSRAAEVMHVSQPTISKMVKNLEDELSVQVFIREGKQTRLTDAGLAIMRYAEPIQQLFDSLEAELADLTGLRQGTLRIGLPPMAGSNFFPHVLKAFQSLYPGIGLQLVEEGARKMEKRLADGSLDVGVLLAPIASEHYDSFPVIQDRLRVVLHPEHPLANRTQIRLKELEQERFILFHADFALHNRMIEACAEAGFSPHIVHESAQWDFIGEMVAADLGIAMLPETICKQLRADRVSSLPLVDPVMPWQLEMCWRKDSYLPHAARAWIELTRTLFSKDRHQAAKS